MFDLNHAIETWKRDLRGQETFTAEDLEELEDHLRADVAGRIEAGESSHEAFAHAIEDLGSSNDLAREFEKVRPRSGLRLRRFGWALYAVSFLLPVYQWGVLWTSDVIRGWEAFAMALDPEIGAYGIASGLTNWLMLATLVPRWRRRPGLARLVVGAAVLDGGWLLLMESIRELQVGYYAWWLSFALVGGGLWLEHRARRRSSPQLVLS